MIIYFCFYSTFLKCFLLYLIFYCIVYKIIKKKSKNQNENEKIKIFFYLISVASILLEFYLEILDRQCCLAAKSTLDLWDNYRNLCTSLKEEIKLKNCLKFF